MRNNIGITVKVKVSFFFIYSIYNELGKQRSMKVAWVMVLEHHI